MRLGAGGVATPPVCAFLARSIPVRITLWNSRAAFVNSASLPAASIRAIASVAFLPSTSVICPPPLSDSKACRNCCPLSWSRRMSKSFAAVPGTFWTPSNRLAPTACLKPGAFSKSSTSRMDSSACAIAFGASITASACPFAVVDAPAFAPAICPCKAGSAAAPTIGAPPGPVTGSTLPVRALNANTPCAVCTGWKYGCAPATAPPIFFISRWKSCCILNCAARNS